MAKSKSTKKANTAVMKKGDPSETSLTKTVADGSPYQLDPAQVERAATALVKNMKEHVQSKETEAKVKNLAADEDEPEDEDEPIFLTLTTKQHIKDSNRLKPNKIALPHPITSNEVRICLITVDPQRTYKDIIEEPSFSEDLRAKIARVIGVDKLRKKYKPYESRRQLLAEYDIFLADDRIVPELPRVLGKVFYSNKDKRPLPVAISQQLPKDKDGKRKRLVLQSKDIAKEVQTALSSTYVHMNPSAQTSIRVGKQSQTPQQLSENISAVVNTLTEKFVSQGWKNIRALHIKGPRTVAVPIWLANELWTDQSQVLDEPWKPAIKEGLTRAGEKKRKWEEWEEDILDEDTLAERRARLNREKQSKASRHENKSISREKRKKLKSEAMKSVQTPLITG